MKKTLWGAVFLLCALFVFCAQAEEYSQGYFLYTVTDESVTITGYFGREKNVLVPSTIAGYPVNTIGKGAFVNTRVTHVTLPDCVTTVEENAIGENVIVSFDTGPTATPKNTATPTATIAPTATPSATAKPGAADDAETCTAHKWTDWDHSKNCSVRSCTICGKAESCQHDQEIADEEIAPTCVNAGSILGSHCSNCGKLMTAAQIIPATGMHYLDENGKCMTCEQEFRIEGLKVITLPEKMNAMMDEAFCGIAAEVIIVPDHCTMIGSRAFANCPSLKYIFLPRDDSLMMAEDAFDGCTAQLIFRKALN